MQSKIQSISNGGSINFQYSFGDKNCDSICKSKYVQKGCKYGFRCNVVPTCQSDGNCICELQMSCRGKNEDNSAGEEITGGDTSSETSESVEITGSFSSEIENGGSHEIVSGTTHYLGMNSFLETLWIFGLNYSCLITYLFRIFHGAIKNTKHIKWRINQFSIFFW